MIVGVSISTEMPGPWRPLLFFLMSTQTVGFNLNRDARPLATHATGTTIDHERQVSISTEMPGPWRLGLTKTEAYPSSCFNLNRDARPLATWFRKLLYEWSCQFQSQPRCQAPGDSDVAPATSVS